MDMSRFAPIFGAVAVFVIGTLALVLASDYPRPLRTSDTVSAASSSSNVSVVPSISLPEISVPNLAFGAVATSTVASSTATTTPAKTAKAVVPAKAPKAPTATTTATSAPVAAPVAATTSSGSASLDASATLIRAALVNIICYAPTGGKVRSISGSGIFIDPKGIILTNAHIAQYFLLADLDISCTIRTGGPAVNAYKAELIYISPSWINANSTILTQSNPIGTGEYDFAFLGVTGSATSAPLPSSFPYIPLGSKTPPSTSPVVIASYGAQFLESSQIQSSLYPTIVFGSIKDIFTFAVNSIDVLALGGSAAAQEGSSGGGVADASGNLVGTITTSTVEGSTDTRSLAAITASYIRSQYAREMNSSLDDLLEASVEASVADFAPEISFLEPIITAQLQ